MAYIPAASHKRDKYSVLQRNIAMEHRLVGRSKGNLKGSTTNIAHDLLTRRKPKWNVASYEITVLNTTHPHVASVKPAQDAPVHGSDPQLLQSLAMGSAIIKGENRKLVSEKKIAFGIEKKCTNVSSHMIARTRAMSLSWDAVKTCPHPRKSDPAGQAHLNLYSITTCDCCLTLSLIQVTSD